MKTLYPVPVSERLPIENVQVGTIRSSDYVPVIYNGQDWMACYRYDLNKWQLLCETADETNQELITHWYTDEPPTHPPAKSLDECMNIIAANTKLAGGKSWSQFFGDPNLNIGEFIDNVEKLFISQFHPHPQDSSSGEVAKNYADGKLGKNPSNHKFTFYGTDLRKIIEDAVNHGLGLKPTPPTSESLEQAAEIILKKHKDPKKDYAYNITHEGIISAMIEFAQQHQKPMAVVLPSDDEIDRCFDINSNMPGAMGKNQYRKSVKELIRTRLDKAGVVDPVEFTSWCASIGTYDRMNKKWYNIPKEYAPNGNPTTGDLLQIYLTEQQNKKQ